MKRFTTQPRTLLTTCLVGVTLLLVGCQQRMAHQPRYNPLGETDFFDDENSSRPLEPGVYARGWLLPGDPISTGLTAAGRKGGRKMKIKTNAAEEPEKEEEVVVPIGSPSDPALFVNEMPFKMSKKDIERGQVQYQVFCVPCHGPLGNGKGKIVERGFLPPPSYHTDPSDALPSTGLPAGYSRGFARYGQRIALKDVPHGYIFEVITRGYGGMPDFSSQIPPTDRWRIVAYVRALQAQREPIDESSLTEAEKKAFEEQKKAEENNHNEHKQDDHKKGDK